MLGDPWENLCLNIEALILRVDPTITAQYAQCVQVTEFVERDPDGYHGRGLFVELDDEHIFLNNTSKRKTCENFPGKKVLIQLERTTGYRPYPEGKLIAVIHD